MAARQENCRKDLPVVDGTKAAFEVDGRDTERDVNAITASLLSHQETLFAETG